MANITRIKAQDPNKPVEKKTEKKVTKKPELKPEKKKDKKTEKSSKKPFLLFRPFIALGRYLKGSWQEIRQVRWPNRKVTWKMVFAVFVYTAIFVIFIMLLDTLFAFLFNILLS